ncbi:MAG: hypothetical protein RLZZ440_159, partial [Planctomycetota bacterium]
MKKSPANLGVVLCCLAVAGLSANATLGSLWTGTVDTNWDNLSNWDSNPNGGNGEVNILTNYPVVVTNNTLVPNDLLIAVADSTPAPTGQVNISAGTFTINYWTKVGDYSGNATLNLAAGTTASPGTFTGLDVGSGSFDSDNNANGNFMIGLYQSTGVFNMNTTGSLNVTELRISPNGQGGSGTFNLDSGSVNVAGSLQVGSDFWGGNTTPANFNMSGGTVAAGGEFWAGGSGTGTAQMTGGELSSSAWFVVGRNDQSVG